MSFSEKGSFMMQEITIRDISLDDKNDVAVHGLLKIVVNLRNAYYILCLDKIRNRRIDTKSEKQRENRKFARFRLM